MNNKIQFSIEAYNTGEYDVVTRDGRLVEIKQIYLDAIYPVDGIIEGDDGGSTFMSNGVYSVLLETENDLFLVEKVTCWDWWISQDKNGTLGFLYATSQQALEQNKSNSYTSFKAILQRQTRNIRNDIPQPAMLKHPHTFTEQKKARLLESIQMIGTLAELIRVEYQIELFDTRFKNPAINNHAGQILRSVKAIKEHLGSISYCKDKEDMEDNFAAEMHVLVKYFSKYPTDKIREFNEGG